VGLDIGVLVEEPHPVALELFLGGLSIEGLSELLSDLGSG